MSEQKTPNAGDEKKQDGAGASGSPPASGSGEAGAGVPGAGDTPAVGNGPAPAKAVTPPQAKPKPEPAAAKVAAPPWQAPDYAGSLTIPQAQWRRANIKPVTEVRRK